ncbi:hypothetical protein PMI10_01739, partial [Flavobacterium sp. CF136]
MDTNIIIQFEHEFHEFAQILMGEPTFVKLIS